MEKTGKEGGGGYFDIMNLKGVIGVAQLGQPSVLEGHVLQKSLVGNRRKLRRQRLGRRIAGAALVLLGLATMVNMAVVGTDLSARTRRWIAGAPDHSGTVEAVSTSPVWVYVAGLGAFAVVVAGLLVAVRGGGWPSMGSRYERRATKNDAESAPDRDAPDTPVANSADTWDALDRGDDPTA
jgi:uncharacterized membrane protein (TIGR02234 family)